MSEGKSTPPIPIFDVKKWTGRMLIASAFAVAALVLADPRQYPYLMIPGLCCIALGQFVRLWGTGHLHKNKVLATGGPYSFVRHPLYVGTFLIIVGLALLSGSWVVFGILLPVGVLVFLFYYAPRKERRESLRLHKAFGEKFDNYHAAVPGFIPRLTPYQDREGRFAFDGIIENREYLITIALVFGVTVIVLKYFFFPDLTPF
jgi:protein-S-isoprenylcysteine O-methyltransferase Ste14